MIAPVRVIIDLARPPVVLILGMFAALGMAQAGVGLPPWSLARALLVVVGYVVFSAGLNDIADVSIDRINLAGDRRRPLVSGVATTSDLVVIALVAGALTLAAAASIGWFAVAIAATGLAVSAAYSLRPFRLCDRGAIASMVLPAAYVVVPYLVGAAGVASVPSRHTLVPLPGLYAAFMGRIVLKDFRDVRGDRLFGKRTFVVRHGRAATCLFSGTFLALGGAWLSVTQPEVATTAVLAVFTIAALALVRELAADRGLRHDERVISAIAIVGRGMVLTLLASACVVAAHWTPIAQGALLAALLAVSLGQARTMVRLGPTGFLPPSDGRLMPTAHDSETPSVAEAALVDRPTG